jgi:lipopolysaccharide export system protein LptC
VRKRILAASGLLVLAVTGAVALWKLRPEPPPPPPPSARSDYVLEDFELTSLDDKGKESFSVQAPHLERDPRGKSLTMRLPQFSFPDRDGGRWRATSGSAWVAEKGVEVRLIDKVEMTGPPTPNGERTQFSTAHLQVFPKQNLAQSQDPVTIRRADSILKGTGLRADMNAKRVHLLADVKGHYVRRPQ